MIVVIWILNRQNVIAEPWDHEELLVQRIHIADAAEIFDANVSSGRLFVLIQSNVPVTLLIRAPRRIQVESLDVLKHGVEVF